MSYNELIALIDACVNRNGVHAITGRIMNGVLKAMVNQLGAGFVLGGVAHPADDPGTPEAPVCYFASEEGTYTHFGGLTIAAGEFALFCYDLTDGWYKETIYEGITEITASIDDQVGTPEVYVEYQNGVLSFDFRNMKGNTGDPAGFGNISADVDANIGTPSVTVSSSGPDTAKVLAFHFKNLKGETGVTSVVATVDNTSGNPTCAVSLNGQELHLDFTGLKGAQGDTGVSADYPIAIVNNLTTNDPTSALSAAMGVQLESEVSQLEHKVDGLAEVDFDPSTYSSTDCYINSSNQWQVGNANSHGRIIPVTNYRGRTVKIKANATDSSYYAFVTNDPVNGDSVAYSTGASRVAMSAEQEDTVTIPNDAVYLWFAKTSYAHDFTPQTIKITAYVGLTERVTALEGDVADIQDTLTIDGGGALVGQFPITHGSNSFGNYSLKKDTQYKFVFTLNTALASDGSLNIKQGATTLGYGTFEAGETTLTVLLPNVGTLDSDYDNVYVTLYDGSYTNKTITVSLSIKTSPLDTRLSGKVGVVKSVNLFDKNSAAIISGKYITTSGYASASGYRISHPIPVVPGVEYKFPKGSGLGTNNNIAVVDAENNFITYKAATLSDDMLTVTAPEAANFLAINLGNQASFLDTCMFCKSSDYPGTYTPYYVMVDNQYNLDASKLLGNIPSESVPNPLSGKIISFNGDSICYGAGYAGGYGKIIAERNGMIYENRGVAGGTIEAEAYYYVAWVNGGTTYYTRMCRPIPGTDKAYTNTGCTEGETAIQSFSRENETITVGGVVYTFSSGDSSARHWICRDVLNMRSDADYIILEGGVNNGGAVPDHGTVSSGYAKATIDALDDYYFAPAFEKMIVNAYNRFPGKKIGFVFVHKMTSFFTSSGDQNTNRYWLAKKCCDKWGIPYVDLNTECPAFGQFPADGDAGLAYLRSQYTNAGDGWHPNEAGYKKYYCDKIEAWLKTL